MNWKTGWLALANALGSALIVRAGHGVDAPYLLRGMADAAGLGADGSEIRYCYGDGLVAIATPETAAKMQNDAECLLLARAVIQCNHDVSKSIENKYVIMAVNDETRRGYLRVWPGSIALSAERHDDTTSIDKFCPVEYTSILAASTVVAIATTPAEADKIFGERKTALQPFGDDDT
ncbi:MAG: hypothetical protein WCP91_02665 [Candidatus Berkelbacteria bacterium]